jgi:predicted TIM-barrel fold metal-dependent hydrolase
MLKRLAFFAILALSAPYQSSGAEKQHTFSPYPDNIERLEGDNGFSSGFGMTNHSYSFDWFDSHLHLAYSHYPNKLKGQQIQEVMDNWFNLAGVYHSRRAILLDPYLETMEWAKDHPRVYVFWWLTWDQADQLPEIKRRVGQGLIQGLKLHTGDFRKKENPDYRVMGSERWHEVYSYCEQQDLPILLHLNQHWGDQGYTYGRGAKEFWEKAGYNNHDLLEYFLEEMASKHPGVKWVLAHMNFQGCSSLAELFDKYPNLYVDTSIGMFLREFDSLTAEEIQPYREFCIKYADRLMFGTDAFAYHPLAGSYPGHIKNWWLPHYIFISRLGLPQETLEKITHGTCEAVLGKYLKDSDQ